MSTVARQYTWTLAEKCMNALDIIHNSSNNNNNTINDVTFSADFMSRVARQYIL